MNEHDELDRLLTAWLTADAPIREPEPLLDRVLARTARTRRRRPGGSPKGGSPCPRSPRASKAPRGSPGGPSAPSRSSSSPSRSAPWSSPDAAKPVPAPFGPAHNGQILYSADGDIVAIDARVPRRGRSSVARRPTPAAIYSPDGLSSLRPGRPTAAAPSCGPPTPTVPPRGASRRDHSCGVVAIGATPSPSRSSRTRSIIRMVAADGSGSTDIETGLVASENPMFRPADGGRSRSAARPTTAPGASTSSAATERICGISTSIPVSRPTILRRERRLLLPRPRLVAGRQQAHVPHPRTRSDLAGGSGFPDPHRGHLGDRRGHRGTNARIRPRGRRRIRCGVAAVAGPGSSSDRSRTRSSAVRGGPVGWRLARDLGVTASTSSERSSHQTAGRSCSRSPG